MRSAVQPGAGAVSSTETLRHGASAGAVAPEAVQQHAYIDAVAECDAGTACAGAEYAAALTDRSVRLKASADGSPGCSSAALL